MSEHIVVTGFGPFKSGSDSDNTSIDHVKNASWEGVKVFRDDWSNSTVELRTEELEVAYEAVDQACERIWAAKPKFVIHVGVAGKRQSIDLEMKSYNGKYNQADVRGAKRSEETIDGPAELVTNIDMLELLTRCPTGLPMNVSDDPGRYLCGYVYYRSLQCAEALRSKGHPCTTLFVHVPLMEIISPAQIATCLNAICTYLLSK